MDRARFFVTMGGYVAICCICAWIFNGFATLLTSLILCLVWWHLIWK